MLSPVSYKRWLIFFAAVALFIQPIKAQYEEKDFVQYTAKDGLSDNYITSIQQDDLGYLWISTDVGLNRFDGHSFKNFFQETTEFPLLSNTIRNLKSFGKDQLGILSRNGFQLLNTRDLSFINYTVPDSTAFSTLRNAAWDAIQLPDRSFAITTAAGFYVINNTGKVSTRHDAYQLSDIGKKRILYGREIFPVNKDEYLVYIEEKGLACYNFQNKTFRNIAVSEKEWEKFFFPDGPEGDRWLVKYQLSNSSFIFIPLLKENIVFYDHARKKTIVTPLPKGLKNEFSWESKVVMLNDSVLAINGGSYGFYLFHLDRQTGALTTDGIKRMPGIKIIRLFFDKDNRLWIGTNEGLFRQKLDPPLINAHRYAPLPGEQITGGITCAYRYKNNLYAGRYSINNGLLIIDPVTMQLKKQINFFGGNTGWNEIYTMEMYHPDTLWIGTNGGVIWLDTRNDTYGKLSYQNKNLPPVSSLGPLRADGYAWISGNLNGIVARYHVPTHSFNFFTSQTQPALPFVNVKNIVYDSYGDVWISGHSLTHWNNRSQQFDTLISVYAGANKFMDDILAISADDNGSLWLHNGYNGLLEYRIKEKRFIPYSKKDGLPSDVLQAFSPIIDHTLWIESNNSLVRFDTKSKKMIVYGYDDGIPESKASGRRMWFDKENNMIYMYATEYLLKFPVQPVAHHENSSGLLIQKITINNDPGIIQPIKELRLKHTENNITINYTIVDFEKNNYRFAYKLDNNDTWTSLGEQRNLNLNNLQPGNYSVHLKAIDKAGNEKIAQVNFVISPPFWKTTWFRIICMLLIAALLYGLYRYRIRQVRQKANIDKLLAQTEMKALHSQMNPHFIFNSLNSIREMILHNENKDASHYLSKFAQLIRMTLDQSGQSFISLRNTLDYLHRYVEMEKIRNSHFTYLIRTDSQLDPDETVLPPMLIQPFIENAIWHGTSAANKDIQITIDFKKEGDHLMCTIDDTGVGIDHSLNNKMSSENLHNPFGIDNIRNRIRLLNEKYDQQSSITIVDKKNINGTGETGTVVTLCLPLEINEA